jgi:hypothetical protein
MLDAAPLAAAEAAGLAATELETTALLATASLLSPARPSTVPLAGCTAACPQPASTTAKAIAPNSRFIFPV